jgi:DNA-binding beta-propeller fold protein YncE
MSVTVPNTLIKVSVGINMGYRMYVVDAGNHRVQILDENGVYISEFGGYGSAEGKFYNPFGLCSDGVLVYVTDTGNNRVQAFTLDGEFVFSFGRIGVAGGEFDEPRGICTQGSWLYVVDTKNDRFQIFTKEGRFVMDLGTEGSGQDQFNDPISCAIDARFLYIDDRGNQRIVPYKLLYVDPEGVPPIVVDPVPLKVTHTLKVSGVADGVTDVYLKMKSFQMRLYAGIVEKGIYREGTENLTAVIPADTEVLADLAARPNGTISIFQQVHLSDGTVENGWLIGVHRVEDDVFIRGTGAQVTVRGSKKALYATGNEVEMTKIMHRQTVGGRTTIKAPMSNTIKPLTKVYLNKERTESIIVQKMTWAVDSLKATFEFTSE